MIATMRKLHLVALSYERDAILDALRQTNAVEVKTHEETEGTLPLPEEGEELRAYLASLESGLDLISPLPGGKEECRMSFSEFMAAGEKKDEMDALVRSVNRFTDKKNECAAEQARLLRARAALIPYENLSLPFDAYADTQHTAVRLGTVPAPAWQTLEKELSLLPLVSWEEERGSDFVLLLVAAHKSALQEAEKALSEAGFSLCPYRGGDTCRERIEGLEAEIAAAAKRQAEAEEGLRSLSAQRRDLEIYCDYVRYSLEKAELSARMRRTERTILLEAFVPAEREEEVKAALEAFSGALFYEFSDPAEDEFVPTLMKNNKVVENFETITNMYSVPSARELDPNTVMSFFYSLFIGFIMADIGYGLLMMLGGGFLYWKNREKSGGIKPLAGVFAVGGIFTVLWGFLFNSLFGIQILPFTVMPDAQSKMWSFIGIDMPAVLLISLLIGIVQLMAGYLCKMAQCIHRNRFWDGVFDGLVWAIFSLGALVAVVGLIEDLGLSFLAPAGGIIAAAALVVAVLTAGRHEKFLGKITKGFSSLYGLINYFTDVLSYIRLYGLMLTGAVIAQIISQYSIQFLTSGNLLIVLGAVLMVVGHVFNLAISLLGAYIHTARLQYVEFFGKFYEGDGVLFTPLGSDRKYVCVL